MRKEKYQKLLSFVSGLSLLFNSFIAPVSVIAQEVTTSDTSQQTTTTNQSTTVTPTPEVTNEVVQTEVTPTADPTADPTDTTEVTPTPTDEVTPTDDVTPTEELSPTPTDEVTPTPTLEPTPSIISEEPVLTDPQATPTVEEPTVEPTATPTIEETPNLLPNPPPDENQSSAGETLSAVIVDGTVNTADPNFDFSTVVSSSATLTTDKSDYSPTETVLIYGENY